MVKGGSTATHQFSKRARSPPTIPPNSRTLRIGLVRKYSRALPNARRTTNDDRACHSRLGVLERAGSIGHGRARAAEARRAGATDAGCTLDHGRLEDGQARWLSEPAPAADRVDVLVDVEGRWVSKRRILWMNW